MARPVERQKPQSHRVVGAGGFVDIGWNAILPVTAGHPEADTYDSSPQGHSVSSHLLCNSRTFLVIPSLGYVASAINTSEFARMRDRPSARPIRFQISSDFIPALELLGLRCSTATAVIASISSGFTLESRVSQFIFASFLADSCVLTRLRGQKYKRDSEDRK